MTTQHLDVLILVARPAAGKSEIIHHLKQAPDEARIRRYHIGPFVEIDDFPMLWTWFEEDSILEKLGHPRLHSTPDQYFIDPVMWHVLIERIGLAYTRLIRDEPDFHAIKTAVIEFSRGKEHGGYTAAFEHLSDDILSRAGALYIDVTFEESLRKNRRRYNPDRPDSILEHGLEDEKMARLYREDDFIELASADPQFLNVRGFRVPYVIFENHDDVTTGQAEKLGARLEARLGALWKAYQDRPG